MMSHGLQLAHHNTDAIKLTRRWEYTIHPSYTAYADILLLWAISAITSGTSMEFMTSDYLMGNTSRP